MDLRQHNRTIGTLQACHKSGRNLCMTLTFMCIGRRCKKHKEEGQGHAYTRWRDQMFVLAGRLVVEIFEDQLPTTCRHLMNRCREGMEDTFKNTVIHKIVPDLAAFGGQSRG